MRFKLFSPVSLFQLFSPFMRFQLFSPFMRFQLFSPFMRFQLFSPFMRFQLFSPFMRFTRFSPFRPVDAALSRPTVHPLASAPSPLQVEVENGRVVEDMEGAAQANQRRMNADPLDVMLLNMGYRIMRGGGPEDSDDEENSEGQVQCRPS